MHVTSLLCAVWWFFVLSPFEVINGFAIRDTRRVSIRVTDTFSISVEANCCHSLMILTGGGVTSNNANRMVYFAHCAKLIRII